MAITEQELDWYLDELKKIIDKKKVEGGLLVKPAKFVGGCNRCDGCDSTGLKGGKQPNPWFAHVNSLKAKHPKMKHSELLKLASQSYSKKGSGLEGSGFEHSPPTVPSHIVGGIAPAVAAIVSNTAVEILPDILHALDESGFDDFARESLQALSGRLVGFLKDPSKVRERKIIIDVLPKLHRNYEHFDNILTSKKISQSRRRQLEFKKKETASAIRQKLASVAGIQSFRQ